MMIYSFSIQIQHLVINIMPFILHADLDAFFASVEQFDDYTLRNKPVVVGGSPESRGVVAAASYEARKFGIHSAMPMITALKRCKNLIRIDPRFDRYKQISTQAFDIFQTFTKTIEPLSIDEAYLEITHLINNNDDLYKIGNELKQSILQTLGLTISVGISTSKSISKIASDINKPDGLTIVLPGTEKKFLYPLDVGKLWGVGPKTTERLKSQGIQTIEDLAKSPVTDLTMLFGNQAQQMIKLANGEDNRLITSMSKRKSFSSEVTLPKDISDIDEIIDIIIRLSDEVSANLSQSYIFGATIKLKLRFHDFKTITRQTSSDSPINASEDISQIAINLAKSEIVGNRKIRMIGVGVSNIKTEFNPNRFTQIKFPGF
ncbi:MAG: DNA polymerase IV [SAR202 cluster bacterium]|mgnify:FL=1|nr:DNA polymerase IV [SAR202 cluster bacterium]